MMAVLSVVKWNGQGTITSFQMETNIQVVSNNEPSNGKGTFLNLVKGH